MKLTGSILVIEKSPLSQTPILFLEIMLSQTFCISTVELVLLTDLLLPYREYKLVGLNWNIIGSLVSLGVHPFNESEIFSFTGKLNTFSYKWLLWWRGLGVWELGHGTKGVHEVFFNAIENKNVSVNPLKLHVKEALYSQSFSILLVKALVSPLL